MITRIEIDGFKSFLDFQLDIPPFLALVGPNASGKSNLFDALKLVADLVLSPDADRALTGQLRGSARDLFHRSADGTPVDRIRITVFMRVEPGPTTYRCHVELALIGERPTVQAMTSTALTPVAEADGTRRPDPHPMIERECRSWRMLVLDPAAMRDQADSPDDGPLEGDGGNLAAVLHRLAEHGELWRIEADLAAVVPGPTEIRPIFDHRRQKYDFDIVFQNAGSMAPRLLSDGTLRVLALSAASHDAGHLGVLAIEEIENGLHPTRVRELVRRLGRGLGGGAVGDSSGARLGQVIVTTHSPVVVAALRWDMPDSLIFLDAVTRVHEGMTSTVTKALPVRDSGEPGSYASPWDVEQLLAAARGNEK
jgi:predicted ATPase